MKYDKPPLVKGGQGRDDAEAERRAMNAMRGAVVAAVLIVIAILILWVCHD